MYVNISNIHKDLFAKLFADTVFVIRNVFVVLSNNVMTATKKAFWENKPSPVKVYNLKHKKKATFVQCRLRG